MGAILIALCFTGATPTCSNGRCSITSQSAGYAVSFVSNPAPQPVLYNVERVTFAMTPITQYACSEAKASKPMRFLTTPLRFFNRIFKRR